MVLRFSAAEAVHRIQAVQRAVHAALELRIAVGRAQRLISAPVQPVGRKGLEGHGGGVDIRPVAADAPAAFCLLGVQERIQQPGSRFPPGGVVEVIPAVQGEQGKQRSIVALPGGQICPIGLFRQERRDQVIDPAARIEPCRVLPCGGQAQDHPGILRQFPFVQHAAAAVHLGAHGLQIQAVPGVVPDAAPGQGQDRPFAADAAADRAGDGQPDAPERILQDRLIRRPGVRPRRRPERERQQQAEQQREAAPRGSAQRFPRRCFCLFQALISHFHPTQLVQTPVLQKPRRRRSGFPPLRLLKFCRYPAALTLPALSRVLTVPEASFT